MSDRRTWPIVVGGCHRSGTSLVRRLLDSHSRIHCGPELGFFRDFYGDYRDDPLAHLRFARTLRSIVPERNALELLGRALVEAHERAARSSGKARWADKAPENVLYLDAWNALLGDRFFLLHVVRNPLDTVASMRGRFPLTLPESLVGLADHYRRYTEAGLRFAIAAPERSHRIVYEELCADPGATLAQALGWLGEDLEAPQLAFNATSHQAGLEDPDVADTDGVHAQSLGRWRSRLSEGEAASVWERTHDVWEACDPDGRWVETPLPRP